MSIQKRFWKTLKTFILCGFKFLIACNAKIEASSLRTEERDEYGRDLKEEYTKEI